MRVCVYIYIYIYIYIYANYIYLIALKLICDIWFHVVFRWQSSGIKKTYKNQWSQISIYAIYIYIYIYINEMFCL